MAAAKSPNSVNCPSCGAKNSPVPANGRCVSCGASIEALKPIRSADAERQRRYQQ